MRGCRLSGSEGQGRAPDLQRETGGGGGSTAGQYTQCTYKCGFEKVAPQHLVALLENRWFLNPASLDIYAEAYSRSEVVCSRPRKAHPVLNELRPVYYTAAATIIFGRYGFLPTTKAASRRKG